MAEDDLTAKVCTMIQMALNFTIYCATKIDGA
jgi:hypothetical protein